MTSSTIFSSLSGKAYYPSIIKYFISMLSNWIDRPVSKITIGERKEVLDKVVEEGRGKKQSISKASQKYD